MGDRAAEVLQALAAAAPPKAWAPVMRTLGNGLCTRRLMGQIGGIGFSFSCAWEDASSEIYVCCPGVADFARRLLGPPFALTPPDQLLDFLLLDQCQAAAPPQI
ncbi:unnamed protein product [Prorocentrum cordatum]|uniref:Uncharacterized protein n=1 Tax=Prorocentrum cordatum TaxID=2364126 RepID=A0ABN9U9H2_9DINO|nr:unnamed protein product [Polarella glacialis]